MKRALLFICLFVPIVTSAQNAEKRWQHQMRFGWGGYPVTEQVMHTWSWCDCGISEVSLGDIYGDYRKPMYSTGAISAEFAWTYRNWLRLTITTAANVTWQASAEAVTGARTGADESLLIYAVPQARFNWLRRDVVKMYGSVGIGLVGGYDLDRELVLFPAVQMVPIGIEVGRKIFGFAEMGYGMIYTGFMAGIGFRF